MVDQLLKNAGLAVKKAVLARRKAGLTSLVALGMAIALVLANLPAQALLFKDLQSHWAKSCIEQLAINKVLSGYPDGKFKPADPVTRAEFAAMLGKAFTNTADVRSNNNFADVPADYWAKAAIDKAYRAGFMSGYLDNLFKPENKIERTEALVALTSGLKYTPKKPAEQTLTAAFADAAAIPAYARNAIAAATEKQLVVAYPDVTKLEPNKFATRAEVAAFLCQAQGTFGLIPTQYVPKVKASADKPMELRGVWLTNIDSDVLFSAANLEKAIQKLQALNFNTIYPAVWNWGYTLYPSAVAEKAIGRSLDPTPGLQGRDMLKEAIALGHEKGLAVLPWFEFGFMAPADSELAKRHPNWLTNRRDGSKVWKEGIHDRVWLNPFHPEVQQFILDLIAEIAGNYDIDGIQVDDHFGLPAEFGYDAFTVALYQKENQGARPPDNFQETYWGRWRADKINEFMGRVFQTIKAKKNQAIVAVSPNPLHFALPAHLQDWFTWERRGYVEELVLQVYRNDINRFIAELERSEVQLAKSHIPVGIGILTGLKGRSVPLEQIKNQVQAARDRGFAGVSFFFYESLSNFAQETSAERESAFKSLFPLLADRPNLIAGWQPPANN